MFKKILTKILAHKIITAIVIIIIAFGVYYGYKSLKGDASQTSYVLAAVEKGTLITSVSGSGQVSASNEVDVKAKTSGDLVYVGISKGQEIKTGALLAQINTREAQSTLNNTQIDLESAKIKLDELLAGADAQALVQAQNAVAQAERDLEKAQKNYDNIETDSEKTLKSAYEDGYSDVSNAFFKLSNYMNDLEDVLGTDQEEQKYVDYYKVLLGQNSLFVQRLVKDYQEARDLYIKNSEFFRETYIDDDSETIYQLLTDTLATTKQTSKALESARHMYDEISAHDYSQLNASSQIEKMQPKIESDLPACLSLINSLENTVDTIDETIENTPDNIKDSELALASAEEKLEDKKIALEELISGADSLDIRSQRNVVAQKEAALTDAREKLSNCFIRAPFDGVVAETNIEKGDSVRSGTTSATLITKQQIAEISLNEVDAASVGVGQKATLTFDAVEDLSISGQVVEMDTLGTVSQGVVSYNVTIGFDTQDERIKPGMSVSASIITDAKLDVLLVPNSAIKTSSGTSYVQMINGLDSQTTNASILQSAIPSGSPSQVAVQTGLSNDTSTEISSGLKEGDMVVTKTTTTSASESSSSSFSLFGLFGGNRDRQTTNSQTTTRSSTSNGSGATRSSGGSVNIEMGPPGF